MSASDDDTVAQTWLEWRKHGIGGSEVAAIVGLSPWESPYSLWCKKAGLLPESDASEAMEFGARAEPMMADYFEDRTGLYVAGEQTWCTHPDEPWMRCTVDGFVFEGAESVGSMVGGHFLDNALGVAEWKTTSAAPAEWEAEIPAYYQAQAQWSMAVTNMPTVWFGVLHLAFGRPQFRVYQLDRDEADIALLTAAARTFWHDHVLTGIPPATDGSDATTAALNAAWEPTDETVEADKYVLFLIDNARALKEEIKDLETSLGEFENELRDRLREATVLTHGVDAKGKPKVLATWKPQTRTSIDTAALKAAEPEIAEKFTRKSESRVLRLAGHKGD